MTLQDSNINLSSESERKEKGKFIRRRSRPCEQPLKVGRFCVLLFVMKKTTKNNYFKYDGRVGVSDVGARQRFSKKHFCRNEFISKPSMENKKMCRKNH